MTLRPPSALYYETLPEWQRWAMAALVLSILVLVRGLLLPPDMAFPFIPFALAVPMVAYLCGSRPGYAFVPVSGIVAISLATVPAERLHLAAIGSTIFVVYGVIIVWIVGSLQSTARAYRNAQETYGEMLRVQTDWVCRVDSEGNFLFLNEAAAQAFGVDPKAFRGHSWRQVAVAEEIPKIEAALAGLAPSNPVVVTESRIHNTLGREVHGHFIHHGIFDTDGKLVEIQTVGRDITDRRKLERRLAELAEEFTDLYQRAPGGYYSLNADGLIVKSNARLADWLGLSLEELVGKRRITEFLTEKGKSAFAQSFPRLKAQGFVEGVETEIVGRNGEPRAVMVNANVVYDEAGRFAHSRSMMNDISEQKNAESAIRRLNANLEQHVLERTAALSRKTEELEGFTYSLSHDLRAPLRAINSVMAMSLEDHGDSVPAAVQQHMQKVRELSARMSRLMDGLLSMSKLVRSTEALSDFSNRELVDSVLEGLCAPGTGRDGCVSVGQLPDSHGEPRLIRQVWENLLSNALKFTRNTAEPRVEIGCDAAGRVFHVRDNGVGFDMKYKQKLFQPFERLHGDADFDGVGIGLALVARIIAWHGGRIWGESEPGRGATFYFTIAADDDIDRATA